MAPAMSSAIACPVHASYLPKLWRLHCVHCGGRHAACWRWRPQPRVFPWRPGDRAARFDAPAKGRRAVVFADKADFIADYHNANIAIGSRASRIKVIRCLITDAAAQCVVYLPRWVTRPGLRAPWSSAHGGVWYRQLNWRRPSRQAGFAGVGIGPTTATRRGVCGSSGKKLSSLQ